LRVSIHLDYGEKESPVSVPELILLIIMKLTLEELLTNAVILQLFMVMAE